MLFNLLYNWQEKYPFNLVEPRLTKINNIEQFGVFAKTNIPENTLIDVCRIIHIDRSIINATNDDIITDYWFNYNKQFVCVVLGNGSLFNHSTNNNVKHYFEKDLMFIYTIKEIKQNEELSFNYGYKINNI